MSTSPRHEPEAPPVEPREEQAAHLDEAYADAQQLCRDAVRKNASLAHVAHYSQGVFDFSVDTLGENARLEVLRQLGRRIGFTVDDLDRRLQEPRTGSLIRTVVHTESGAVLCESVVPRENVVGICRTRRRENEPLSKAADVRAADQAMSDLVRQLRARVSLLSQNHGGWETADEVEALTSVEPQAEPQVVRHADVPDEIVAACRAKVRPEDLQYVGYCSRGALLLEMDHLGHPSLAPFFTQITVAARRAFYRGFAVQLATVAQHFNRLVASATPRGRLLRLVLDVEQGAIYYYRLTTDSYLVGVTITQSRVSGADDRMADLAIGLMPG